MSNPEIKYDLIIKHGNLYGPDDENAVLEILRKNAPTSGEYCAKFENEYAEYCGSRYAKTVSNGTAALFLALKALDVGPGDRVLTTPVTWIATASAAVTLGAEIDFVDIDPVTCNMDPSKLEEKITDTTKAVIPVHLYGQCVDMDEILEITDAHGIRVIEDACHAPGALYKGRKAGSLGDIGCFSFHEQKNMSTLGEGGIVTTSDPELFERISLYRSHCTRVYGKSTKYCELDQKRFPMGKKFWFQDFDDCGYNFRMTDIQAAVGSVQLKKLDVMNDQRIRSAEYLIEKLKDVPGLEMPSVKGDRKHVFHLFPVRINQRVFGMNKTDFIYRMYYEKGVKVGAHYGVLHLTTAFRNRGFKEGDFPVAEKLMGEVVTLPVKPGQTEEALEYLVDSIKSLAGAS